MDNLQPVREQIRFVRADILDPNALQNAFAGADYILHHAAAVSVPQSVLNPAATLNTNVQGTANVLEAARRAGAKRVVFASSCAVYGAGSDRPLAETDPTDVQSPYALSKLAGEDLCRLYTRLYGLETVVLRYFNVYGPGQSAGSAYAAVIARFLDCAARGLTLTIDWDGSQTRDFIHVQDVARATLLAAEKGTAGQTYNVGGAQACSIARLAELVEETVGHKLEKQFAPKRGGDVHFSRADTAKLQALGFCPEISLLDGLKDLWLKRAG